MANLRADNLCGVGFVSANDGTVWSNYITGGTLSGSYPATHGFDGDITSFVYAAVDGTMVWTAPNGGIKAGRIEVYVYAGNTHPIVEVNGASTGAVVGSATPAQLGNWVDVTELVDGHLKTITCYGREVSGVDRQSGFSAVRINGEILTDGLVGTKGGRNAIDGSVFFDGTSKLSVPNSADVRLGSNDFTIEAWIKVGNAAGSWEAILGMWDASNTRRTYTLQRNNSSGQLYLYVSTDGGSTNWAWANGGNVTVGDWHHVAGVRDGNTLRVYLNGVEVDNSSYSGTIYNNTTDALFIGDVETDNSNNFNGYISNARLVNGTCLYPSGTTFTPPTQKLTTVANTQVLACQDSDDATQEATGKTITAYGGFRQDKTEGNLLTNTLDWDGAASSYSTTMPDNWTAGNGAQVLYATGGTSGGAENRMLRLRNDGSNSYIYQTIPTVIGQKYQIDLWYEAENSSLAVKWLAGTSATGGENGYEQWTVGSNGDQATRTGSFNASATTTYITFQIISGTNDASVFVDDIQVKAFNPKQPKVFPPVGVDAGLTFEGDTKVNSQGVMYFPTGDTSQRGRGRGVLGGGAPFVSPNVINAISYVEIQSGGTFKDFGDLTVARGYFVAGQTASSTRGISAGGWTGSGNNTIDYITIATTSNAINFGDTSVARPSGGLSNQTRSLSAGDAGALGNHIDYVTIASTGDAQDFGDLIEGRGYLAGVASPTRGVFGGGRNNTPSSNTLKNTMEYITIATTGNTTDFGDLQALRYGQTAFSSSVRGIWAGGYATPGQTATIDYFTIATFGNSFDFGDLGTANGYCGSVTNSIRGAVTINDSPNYYNTIEYITIATTGDAKDFGDADPLGSGKGHGNFPSGMSDSHGGLS